MEKRSITTHQIRERLGEYTQEQFAKAYDIPIGTVKNWDARGTMPEYLETLFWSNIVMHEALQERIGYREAVKELYGM